MIFFHPRARYDVKCICGAPSIASGGGNHRYQRDGNRRSAHSPILAYLSISWHARRAGWNSCRRENGFEALGNVERNLSPKFFPPSMCFIRVCQEYTSSYFLLSPPFDLSFVSISQDFQRACAFNDINLVIVTFETIVHSGIICYSIISRDKINFLYLVFSSSNYIFFRCNWFL